MVDLLFVVMWVPALSKRLNSVETCTLKFYTYAVGSSKRECGLGNTFPYILHSAVR